MKGKKYAHVYKSVGEGLLTVGKNCFYQRKEEKEQVVNISVSNVIGRQCPGDYCSSVEMNTPNITNCYTEVWNAPNY